LGRGEALIAAPVHRRSEWTEWPHVSCVGLGEVDEDYSCTFRATYFSDGAQEAPRFQLGNEWRSARSGGDEDGTGLREDVGKGCKFESWCHQ